MLKGETAQILTQGVSPEKIGKVEEKNRKTGIDAVGDAPFGTHFCLFYETKEDLIDVLVPYFKAGLESNEFCMWVTSEPLSEEEAKEAMRRAVPNFDGYVERGQIEIVPYTEWYLKGGAFNFQRVLSGWVEKLNQALAKGYDGMRVTGNMAWLEKRDWRNFVDYEQEVNRVVGKYRMLVICTYSLGKCVASEILDVVRNHQFAVIKREGKWELIESSELKRAKEQFQAAEESLQNTLDNMLEGCQIIGYDWRYLYVNDAVVKHGRTTKERVLGKTMMEMYPGIEKTEMFSKLQRCMKERVSIRMENEFEFPDGGKGWFDLSIQPVPEGIFMLSFDITERKKMESALRESEERYQTLVENSPNLVGIYQDSVFKFVNRAMCEELGWTPEELTSPTFDVIEKLFPQRLYDLAKENIAKRLRGEYVPPYETSLKRRDDVEFPVLVLNKMIRYKGQPAIEVILVDITERKRMEDEIRRYSESLEEIVEGRTRELKEAHERLQALFQTIPDAVYFKDAQRRFLVINTVAEKIMGLTQEEIVGKTMEQQMPSDFARTCRISDEEVLRKRKILRFEEQNIDEKGEKRFFETIKAPMHDSQGNVMGLVGVSRDITEHKQMEQQLLKSERLTAVGEAAAMVGHDLRNPLQVIVNMLYLVGKKFKSIPIADREILEKYGFLDLRSRFIEQVEYMDKIVSDLQDYARPLKPKLVEIGLHKLIDKTLSSLTVPENVKVSIVIEEDFPKLMLDPGLMQRVFSNLITNAVQAMPNGGKLTIRASEKEETALISVEDTGVGISDANLSKLFTLLFTTKARGQGFGLPVCKRMVEAHDGNITVASKVGKGSTFTIKIPLRTEVSYK